VLRKVLLEATLYLVLLPHWVVVVAQRLLVLADKLARQAVVAAAALPETIRLLVVLVVQQVRQRKDLQVEVGALVQIRGWAAVVAALAQLARMEL